MFWDRARQFDIALINAIIPTDWRRTIVAPIYKGGGLKLQARQFNLSGLQVSATHYSIVPEENLG
jgi:hypothetical protein